MSTMIFLNLPVTDVAASRSFYTALGYPINEDFSDDSTACVVVSGEIYLMVMTRERFAEFSPKEVADPDTHTTSIACLSADSRAGVDELVDKALANGGRISRPTMEKEPMCGRSFQDPDGHLWEVMWMDMSG